VYQLEINVADYSSLEAILRSLDRLNDILSANGEHLQVSLENLELVFSQLSPIVAVNGRLAFVGSAPTTRELAELLRSAEVVGREAAA
jgi:hypothetical protein